MTLHHLAASTTNSPTTVNTVDVTSEPTLWLIVAAAIAIVGYLIACAIWPFAACRWCSGSGKKRSPSGRAWRPCRHCKATGARVRLGRQLVTVARRTHRAGTRGTRKRTTSWRNSSQ